MKQHPHHPHNISIDGSRLLNKYLFNRIIIALAKSGKGPFSVVYHVGRQSEDRKMGATNPKVIGSMDAFAILPEKRRRLFERFETEKFLLLMVIENK